MYYNKSLKSYLDDLSARKSTPGGGAAAALTSAMGMALISMVINFSKGEMRGGLRKSESLRKEFLKLVDLDIFAFKSGKKNLVLNVPLKVARLSKQGIKLCALLFPKANKNLISDVAVAAVLLEAGFGSAYFNVKINLRNLEKKRSAKIIKELQLSYRYVRNRRAFIEEKCNDVLSTK
ncbi:MAG: cyclodeaminase/cyclohydrolase family protein [Candidatus Omnitrophica bacterium]|nr:cyclodeaminase/cyclohydrolase family protein [Candidatus Omnitrophota bacterium]